MSKKMWKSMIVYSLKKNSFFFLMIGMCAYPPIQRLYVYCCVRACVCLMSLWPSFSTTVTEKALLSV